MSDTRPEIGDRITFKVPTRSGAPTLTRVVNGRGPYHSTVRALGWGDFIVFDHEVIKVTPKEEAR